MMREREPMPTTNVIRLVNDGLGQPKVVVRRLGDRNWVNIHNGKRGVNVRVDTLPQLIAELEKVRYEHGMKR
jgi:hypothetical protein